MTKQIWALVHPSPAINVYPSSRLSPPDLWAPHGSTGGPHLECPFWIYFPLANFWYRIIPKHFGQQKTNVVGSSGKCTFSRCLPTAGDHLESNQRKLCLRQILFNLMLLATSELPILMSEKFFGEKTRFWSWLKKKCDWWWFQGFLLFTVILRKVVQFDQSVSNGCLNHLTLDVVAWSTKTKGHQKKGPATMN